MPSHPTPNGRLHLGHIAGPYLKMDVIRRALRRRGERVCMMLAIDSFDSYVQLRAHQTGKTNEEVVAQFRREILEGLTAFDIGTDVFIDPLDQEWSRPYRETLLESLSVLRANGSLGLRQESFLWSPKSSRFITGCWLQGQCPGCGREAGGYSCEACGLHYRPEEMVNARARLNEGPLESVQMHTIFLHIHQVAALQRYIEATLPDSFAAILRRYIERSGPSLRVTVPGSWGVHVSVEGESFPQVIFSGFASLGLLWTYGHEYARRFSGNEPFHSDSNVVTVCSFGIDNTISRVISCGGGVLEYPNRQPPNHLLLNHFYRLEGAKFSTSRNHAIWASEIASIAPAASDAMRLYLLETAPEDAETDFRVAGFLGTVNKVHEQCNMAITQSLAAIASTRQTPTSPDSLTQALIQALDRQDECLDLRSLKSRDVPGSIYKWIEYSTFISKEASYWWLKGLALIAWPVLPKTSGWLWSYLGHDGDPTEAEYLNFIPPRDNSRFVRLEPLTLEQIRGCLPPSLYT